MWVWHWVQRRWLDALIWALVATGTLSMAAAMQEHGVRFLRIGRDLDLRPSTIHAYALALIPLWMAAVLHLLRQRHH